MVRVPTLTQTTVSAAPLPGPVITPRVSALEQGGGVGEGLQQLGQGLAARAADEAAEAARMKAKADQAAAFFASAEARTQADVAWQSFADKDGPAAMQAAETTLPEFDRWVAERRDALTPDQRGEFDQHVVGVRESLRSRVVERAHGVLNQMTDAAQAAIVQANVKSAVFAVAGGGVRVAQLPGLPPVAVGILDDAEAGPREVLDESAIAPHLSSIDASIERFAELNADRLPTDVATYVATAKRLAREDVYKGVVDALLSRGDDRAAARFFEAHKAEFAEGDLLKVAEDVDRASAVGETERAVATIWESHLGDAGTWSERKDAMLADVPAGDLSGDIAAGIRKMVDAARADEGKRQADAHAALDERWQAGESLSSLKSSPQWGDMTPDAQRAMEKLDADRLKGLTEPAEPDPAVYMGIVEQYANPATRGEFAARDLLTDYPNLTPEQRREVTGWQKELKAGGATATVDDAVPMMLRVAGEASKALALQFTVGGKDDRKKDADRIEADVFKQMQIERKAALAANKPWGEAEANDVRDRNLAMIAYGSGETKPAFLLVPDDIDEDDITPERRAFIAAELRARRLPDDDEAVAQAYINLLRYDDVQAPWGSEP